MKLNKSQKQFLFDNYYVTAESLDACVEPGWKDYFIKYFDWSLEGKDQYGFEKLYLIDKKSKDIEYRLGLNFQSSDLKTLKNLK